MIRELLDRIKACGYHCEAGPLANNTDFKTLEKLAVKPNEETVVINEEGIYEYIFSKMTAQRYAVSIEAIKIILELEFEYLKEKGVVEETDG